MSLSDLLQFFSSVPGVFSTPLPWPAELAFLILCVTLLSAPGILKCFPYLRQGMKRKPRRSAKSLSEK